ncbi:stress-induced-phosphoprotein 1-like [Ischnura elegans]|uniref:stress-induced-phosphoprotein 1-like n=1 Tax=Ischnura elegans TaxID=197161 RepID=UPI001ED86B2B|nr:stress-induced-phosphoprotein 1-like [Ischnura elegans]
MASADEVQEQKEEGNKCVKDGNYIKAVLHYTNAIKLDPQNFSLYSNRSLVLLKMQQYYYALQDANETIRLKPDWAKGYFRKGEVEYATFHFSDALLSYKMALDLQPDDQSIMEAIRRATQGWQKDRKADEQIPWLGAGIGIIIGVTIVIAEHVLMQKPTLGHPILMALLTIGIAMLGYGIARGFRYYVKCQRKALLEDPSAFLGENKEENEEEVAAEDDTKGSGNERGHRYTKAQARQRFKKGKS